MREKPTRIPVYSWVVFLVFFCTFIVYFDRINISVVAPVLLKQFHWSDATLGVVLSMFFVGYTITQIPGGILSDRYGGGKLLGIGSFLWSLFTILTAFATGFASLIIYRIALGLGEGVNFPAGTAVISRWVPKKARARAQGLNLSAIALGPFLATPISVAIMEAWGWPMVFIIYGMAGFLWLIIWAFFYKDHPEDHPLMSAAELAAIQDTGGDHISRDVKEKPFLSKEVWGLAISYFFLLYTLYLFLTWLPTYLIQAHGISIKKMGIFATLPWGAAFLTMNFSGWFTDRLVSHKHWSPGPARRLMIYIGFIGMAIFVILGGHATSAGAAVGYLIIGLGFLGIMFPSYWALPIDYAPKQAGAVSGLMNTLGNCAGIASPMITGFIVTFTGSWSLALYLSSLLAIIGAIIMAVSSKKKAPAHA